MSLAQALRQGWLDYKAKSGQELPQKHLGVLVGRYLAAPDITEAMVSRWLADKADPTPEQFMACCAVLGLDPWRASGVTPPEGGGTPPSRGSVGELDSKRDLAKATRGGGRTAGAEPQPHRRSGREE